MMMGLFHYKYSRHFGMSDSETRAVHRGAPGSKLARPPLICPASSF